MKLPGKLYVKVEKLRNDDPYLSASSQIVDMAGDMGEEVELGVYKLHKRTTIRTMYELTDEKE